MGTKRQAIWVSIATLIISLLVASVSYMLGYKQSLTTQHERLYALEEKVNKSLYDNLKQGIVPSRNHIYMVMRSEARRFNVGRIDSTSLNRVIENITARIFQDSVLVQERKMDLLKQAESLAINLPMHTGYKFSNINQNRYAILSIIVIILLIVGLPVVTAFLFYHSGPNRMTQSSLGTFVETLIKYLYSRYENTLALTLVEENLVLSPKNPYLYTCKSRLLLRTGRSDEALRTIDQGLDICAPSAKPLLLRNRAICLSKLGRQEEAIKELSKANHSFWGKLQSIFERGDLLRAKIEVLANDSSPEEAMSESNKLVAKFPRSPLTFAMRAPILRKNGYVEDAMLAAERTIELSRGQSDPSKDTRTAGLLSKAAAYSMMDRFEESFELLVQHLPHESSSLLTIENIFGFDKILKDNIYSKKLKDVFRDHKNSHAEVSERNYFL